MLRDPTVETNDTELVAIIREFHLQIAHNRDHPQFSWHLGLQLFDLFAARREVPSLRILESIRIPYRDDNRVVWELENAAFSAAGALHDPASVQVRRNVSVIEMANTP